MSEKDLNGLAVIRSMEEKKRTITFSRCYVNKGQCWLCGKKEGVLYYGLELEKETVLVPICNICANLIQGKILKGIFFTPDELHIQEHIEKSEKESIRLK